MNFSLDYDVILGFRRAWFEKFYNALWILAIIFLLALGPLILYSNAFTLTKDAKVFDFVSLSANIGNQYTFYPLISNYNSMSFQNVSKSEFESIFGLENFVTDLMYIYKAKFSSTNSNVLGKDFSPVSYKYIDDFLTNFKDPLELSLLISSSIDSSFLSIKSLFSFDFETEKSLKALAEQLKLGFVLYPEPAKFSLKGNFTKILHVQDFSTITSISAPRNSIANVTLRHITESYSKSYWDLTNIENATLENTFELYLVITSNEKSSITFVKNIALLAFYTSTVLIIVQAVYAFLNPNPVETWLVWIPFGRKILQIIDAIEIARENFNYYLERMLYLKLLDIFRSPELIKAITMETHQYVIQQDKLEITKEMNKIRKAKSKRKEKQGKQK